MLRERVHTGFKAPLLVHLLDILARRKLRPEHVMDNMQRLASALDLWWMALAQ